MSLHFIFDKFSECPFKTKIFKLQFLLDKSSKSYTDNYTFRLLFELKCLPEPPRLPLVLRLRGFESSVSDEVDDSVDFLLSLRVSMNVKHFPRKFCGFYGTRKKILCVIVGSLLSVDFIDVNIRGLKVTIFGSSIKIKRFWPI